MSNFRFAKVVAGVGPMLAKETILSKIINMVDVFRISLSEGFDDNNRKYIDTILKLDNSKTIMLETRGNDSRVKNIFPVKVKKGQEIIADYSEYAQEGTQKIYIDYPYLGELKEGTILSFEQSDVSVKVTKTEEDFAYCKILKGGEILQYDRVESDSEATEMPFLLDRDKKDILRGLEQGIHMIAASGVKTAENIALLQSFLDDHNAGDLKIFSKIETPEALDNLEALLEVSDGVILVLDKLEPFMKKKKMTQSQLISKCKDVAKPVIITYIHGINTNKYPLAQDSVVKSLADMAIDGFMLETIIREDSPLDLITEISELLGKYKLTNKGLDLKTFHENEDFIIRDYIIYNAYRITQELDIKAIVCYTENGYTTSRLSSLTPSVPVIAFTKLDSTYRFLNSLQGVKGYKISQSFNYENLKRIGKEMIRIIFKGNISLDDKVIIVQANEVHSDTKSDMINGVELYKFKNI